jgi:c(7)-type cytochrome triheme protein
MRKTLLVALAVASLCATSIAPQGDAIAQAGPADITYAAANGNVTYSHAKHLAKYPACTECHPTPFGMAKSDLGMEKAHTGCGKCHKAGGPAPTDVTAAATCTSCHKAP